MKHAARFVTRNYSRETGNITGILEELKLETLQKRKKDNRLILLYKGLKGKAIIPNVDVCNACFLGSGRSQKTGVADINIQWPFRFPLLLKTSIRKASFPKLSGTLE